MNLEQLNSELISTFMDRLKKITYEKIINLCIEVDKDEPFVEYIKNQITNFNPILWKPTNSLESEQKDTIKIKIEKDI